MKSIKLTSLHSNRLLLNAAKLGFVLLMAVQSLIATDVFAIDGFSYKGIPYLDDELPDEILPDLPDGPAAGNTCWSKYDPITDPLPVYTEASNQYYVDSSSTNGTAGNNGRGSPNDPIDGLKALPFYTSNGNLFTIPADTQVFIVGNGNTYLPDGKNYDVKWQCNEDMPCYFIGVGSSRPVIRPDKFFMGGSDYILSNLEFYQSDDKMRLAFGHRNVGSSLRGVLRDSIVRGKGTTESSNTLVKGEGVDGNDRTKCTLIYNNEIKDNGDWDNFDTGDAHGIQFTFYLSYTWIIDNKIYHVRGDSIQSGINTTDTNWALRQHYSYIAGNELFETGENAYDDKQTAHVIISENKIYNVKTFNKAADATAVILSNNTEGPRSSYNWFILNHVYNEPGFDNETSTIGIRDAGTTDGERNFIIGNYVEGYAYGLKLANNGLDRESWWIHNTVKNCSESGLSLDQPGINAAIYVRRNVFSDCQTVGVGNNISVRELVDNLLFNTVNNDPGKWTREEGNLTVIDPIFLQDMTSSDFTLTNTSAVYDKTTDRDSAFDLFQSLYGIPLDSGVADSGRYVGASSFNRLGVDNSQTAAPPMPPVLY